MKIWSSSLKRSWRSHTFLLYRLQPWDVLIDDLSSPVSLAWGGIPDSGSAHYAYKVTDCEDDFYDLQYALEISRRDRRKTMDSRPDSAGEYSKACSSYLALVA